jgi:hypothetical protein
MNGYPVYRHYEAAYEVFPCSRCGDVFRCCPVCPGNRAWCPALSRRSLRPATVAICVREGERLTAIDVSQKGKLGSEL